TRDRAAQRDLTIAGERGGACHPDGLVKKQRQYNLSGLAAIALSVCVLGAPLSLGLFLGMELASGRMGDMAEDQLASFRKNLEQQKRELKKGQALADSQVKAMTVRLAEMQARLVRLDALGGRLAEMADLAPDDFDFSVSPPLGGPAADSLGDRAALSVSVQNYYDELARDLDQTEQQLLLLDSLYQDNSFQAASQLEGKPLRKGWISSGYGYRTDPFAGKKSWHNGMDFAGKEGAPIVAVASGIVTKSEAESGYGLMVEIDHGKGYVTRYGHNKENLVKVGDLVSKGQVIASVGSSGRATGPHVHFEVFKHGRSVDPASYIRRNLR
ncbi:MAG: M23 family metallopeptidase, partial [bacterium]